MLFNSYPFLLLYLPVVLLGYFQLARIHHRLAAGWLTLASLFFYAYWNPAYVALLLGSILCNFGLGAWIANARPSTGKARLLVSVSANLLLLGYYKYANFFVSNLDALTGTSFSPEPILLPLGISF